MKIRKTFGLCDDIQQREYVGVSVRPADSNARTRTTQTIRRSHIADNRKFSRDRATSLAMRPVSNAICLLSSDDIRREKYDVYVRNVARCSPRCSCKKMRGNLKARKDLEGDSEGGRGEGGTFGIILITADLPLPRRRRGLIRECHHRKAEHTRFFMHGTSRNPAIS